MKRQALRDRAWRKAQRQRARREEPWKFTSDNNAIILKVIRDLYTDQIVHWKGKLEHICHANNVLHAEDDVITETDPEDRSYIRRNRRNQSSMTAGIRIDSHTCLHWQVPKVTPEEGFYYLPVHKYMPEEVTKELSIVHSMLDELFTERAVIRKFLSFAMGFGVTWDYFAQSLDSDILTDYFNESRVVQPAMDLEDPAVVNKLAQFDEYIAENKAIVETMANRQLENLLLGDIL